MSRQPVVADRVQGGGEAVVGAGLLVGLAELARQRQGGGVGDPRLVRPAGGEQDLGHAVARLGLAGPVAGLPEQREGPLVAADRLLEQALPLVGAAEVGQRAGLAGQVAGLRTPPAPAGTSRRRARTAPPGRRRSPGCQVPAPRRSARRRSDRRPGPAGGSARPAGSGPVVRDGAEVGQRGGLAPAVADRGRRGQRPLVVVGRLLVAALPPADDAEVGERHRLGGAVAEQAGRVVRAAVHGHRVGVVAAGLQVAVQDGRQPGGVTRPAVGGRVQGDRDEDGALGVEPAARPGGGGRLRGGRAVGSRRGR